MARKSWTGEKRWREREREATATASLYYTRRKKWEREREKALLMIIFLTPRKMTAITPRGRREEANTDCRPWPPDGWGAKAEAL